MKITTLILAIFIISSCSYFRAEENKLTKVEILSKPSDSIQNIEVTYDSLYDYLNYFFPDDFTNDEQDYKMNKKDSAKFVEEALRILNNENITNTIGLMSKDENLIVFSKEQVTGGSASVENHILAYKTKTKSYKLLIPFFEEEDKITNISGANIEDIYKLPSKNGNLYLLIGGGKGNNSVNYSLASVIELKNDTINFEYPAFEFKDSNDMEKYLTKKSSFTIEYSNSNYVLENVVFEYDSIKNQIHYKYLELNYSDNGIESEKLISKKLKFDGTRFKGFVY